MAILKCEKSLCLYLKTEQPRYIVKCNAAYWRLIFHPVYKHFKVHLGAKRCAYLISHRRRNEFIWKRLCVRDKASGIGYPPQGPISEMIRVTD